MRATAKTVSGLIALLVFMSAILVAAVAHHPEGGGECQVRDDAIFLDWFAEAWATGDDTRRTTPDGSVRVDVDGVEVGRGGFNASNGFFFAGSVPFVGVSSVLRVTAEQGFFTPSGGLTAAGSFRVYEILNDCEVPPSSTTSTTSSTVPPTTSSTTSTTSTTAPPPTSTSTTTSTTVTTFPPSSTTTSTSTTTTSTVPSPSTTLPTTTTSSTTVPPSSTTTSTTTSSTMPPVTVTTVIVDPPPTTQPPGCDEDHPTWNPETETCELPYGGFEAWQVALAGLAMLAIGGLLVKERGTDDR